MDNDIVNLLMWACGGALGIVCSYYGSQYLAKGTVYVFNDYFNYGVNLENVENFYFGSLCFTVVCVCGPHIMESFLNIVTPNIVD